ncbi:MAG: YggT family protein [Rubrivivax sp.]|nr:YggT family protein [Rubrivivax sp.]
MSLWTKALVLLFLSAVKLVCEIALMALLGRGLLAILAGDKRQSNFFYGLLSVLTRPFLAVARWITPRQVADAHVGFVAFSLLLIIWVIVTLEKVSYCVGQDMVGCR